MRLTESEQMLFEYETSRGRQPGGIPPGHGLKEKTGKTLQE